ncbi:mucin-5AC-like isoform X1 [Myxocyprinus asiaticus]|uniref:mucin-5AC-like isoform X1 n=1 Tax=Myxocyprinus asiaticus TaxID=70543 RepID=UPI002222234C|nr:mucin-5AC-like isoform X1 [Myxocyprinus asiaticus]
MRLTFSNLLLSLALGLCFMFIYAQEQNETDTNATTTLLNKENVDTTLSPEDTIEVKPENIVTELPTTPDPDHTVSTLDHQMTTIHEEKSTVEASTPLITDTEQTTTQSTPRSVSEGITAQGQQTTTALEPMEANATTVPVKTEKGGTAPITSEYLPSTGRYETTVGFTTSELSSATKHRDDLTTAMVALTPASMALSSTPTTLQPPAEGTEPPPIMSSPEDTTFLTITTKTSTKISTSKFSRDIPDLHHLQLEDDSVSTHLTPATTGGNVKHSILPTQINWLLILIVCVILLCVVLVTLLIFVQRRKKIASRKFGPGYMNGQSKRSKKKKGAEDDAWAGPVNLEAGDKVECDGVVQGGLLSDEGREDGDDLVLSTFAALESGDTPNGGVGGEGTKEVKKWEEQEPLLYIDENVEEDNKEKAVAEKQKQKGDENNGKLAVREIKELNGGEAFCLTTAV